MGTIRWDLCAYGRNRGSGAATLPGAFIASGVHTSSTTASNLTDGAAGAGSAITAPAGAVLRLLSDELGRVRMGGVAATATAGFLLEAGVPREFEVAAGGTVSVIDEA